MGNAQAGGNGRPRKISSSSTTSEDAKPTAVQHPEFLVKLAKILVKRCIEEDNLDGITEGVFQRYLFPNLKLLAKKLFVYLKHDIAKPEASEKTYLVSKETFMSSAEGLLQFVREDQQIELYTKVFAEGRNKITEEELKGFLVVAFLTTGLDQAANIPPNLEQVLNAILTSIHAKPGQIIYPDTELHKKSEVTVSWVQNWIQKNAPYLLVSLHELVMNRLTSTYAVMAQGRAESSDEYYQKLAKPVLSVPLVEGDDPFFDPALMWLLTSSLPLLFIKRPKSSDVLTPLKLLRNARVVVAQMASDCNEWCHLYDSNVDGLSMTRLKTEILSYRGPTLMFVKSEIGHTYCIATDVEWKESHQYYGGDDCRLIQISPNYNIIESGSKLIYFNLTSRGYPMGIIIGQDFRKPSLKIGQTLNIVEYKNIPSKLQEIRVFGCGRADVKQAQEKQKNWEKRQAEKARIVNLQCDWTENPDRYLLEMASSRQSYSQYIS